MNPGLSANTQAILLLTAPLIAGRRAAAAELLSPGEYQRLARHLRELGQEPAALLAADADALLRACNPVVEETRLARLLERGFLLGQVVEGWQARAIWVLSRADAAYPQRLKARLREQAPAILYGCGDPALLETGGLAVVGSRRVDEALIDYTRAVGRLAADAGRSIVSGGARGIDQAAMHGALEAQGSVAGVLADSLQRAAMNRDYRNGLLGGQLALVSPWDPNAGFNVGHAMQRNKLIYALADAALVVNSDRNKGGTWAGATEQLERLRFVPVYVRSSGAPSDGLDALRSRGARPWPNPPDPAALAALLDSPPAATQASAPGLFAPETVPAHGVAEPEPARTSCIEATEESNETRTSEASTRPAEATVPAETVATPAIHEEARQVPRPADALLAAARAAIIELLAEPMKDSELATALDVTPAQARAWLARLVDEGVVEKRTRPVAYVVRQKSLFG